MLSTNTQVWKSVRRDLRSKNILFLLLMVFARSSRKVLVMHLSQSNQSNPNLSCHFAHSMCHMLPLLALQLLFEHYVTMLYYFAMCVQGAERSFEIMFSSRPMCQVRKNKSARDWGRMGWTPNGAHFAGSYSFSTFLTGMAPI